MFHLKKEINTIFKTLKTVKETKTTTYNAFKLSDPFKEII